MTKTSEVHFDIFGIGSRKREEIRQICRKTPRRSKSNPAPVKRAAQRRAFCHFDQSHQNLGFRRKTTLLPSRARQDKGKEQPRRYGDQCLADANFRRFIPWVEPKNGRRMEEPIVHCIRQWGGPGCRRFVAWMVIFWILVKYKVNSFIKNRFLVISRQMFNPNYALFQQSPTDKVTYRINPLSWINTNHMS